MDGFDDLLNPSRHALEDNPFADPFLKRSGSPDPWATPFTSTDTSGGFGSTSDHFGADSTYHSTSQGFSLGSTEEEHPKNPLNLPSEQEEDDEDNKPLGNLRSPGFRESIPSNAPAPFSETATIRPTHEDESHPQAEMPSVALARTPPQIISTSAQGLTSLSASITVAAAPLAHSRTTSGFASTSQTATESSFKSPLESFGGLEHSITGLSLGGEAATGWQTEETPWQTESFSPPRPTAAATAQVEDDSDDDKPILQSVIKQHGDVTSTTTTRNDSGLQPVFVITVDDPQKVGDPIRSFTMYTVHTRTTSPLFQKSAFSVLRRYSDFLWLYETLSNNNPGVVVPPVPDKNTFGRFDDQFVRQRRLALEKCIQKTANHPVLGKDPDLRMFLESDSFALDIKHRKAEIAHERGGLLSSIGQSITGPRFHETDEWFDRQKAYLDSLEQQLRGLAKAIENVSKQRQEVAVATGEFSQNVSDLASSDIGKQLAQSLNGLADVERTTQDIHNIQSEQDITTLMSTVDEYARLINSVRLAFSSRIRVYHAWKNQENELLRTKQTHEKNRAQGRIPTDRLGISLSQIAEAERRASEAKLEYEQVSKLVKQETARFEQERIEDFKDSLHAFLEGMISRQKELIATWEKYQQMLLKKVGGGATSQASGSSVIV
ncbi:protein transporter [Pholiota conissans]|uniref:Protein transporter n=1 Tax=Pholiota conissans TaxID=109636 RepID=A0A9P5YT08_9AGAR|nr:protein transporter [Pholiota conissans]